MELCGLELPFTQRPHSWDISKHSILCEVHFIIPLVYKENHSHVPDCVYEGGI